MTTIIKVYEDSEDYQFEDLFLVDITKKEKEKLLRFCEKIQELDYEEREEKYGCDSVIELIENYISNNLKNIDYEMLDIDTY